VDVDVSTDVSIPKEKKKKKIPIKAGEQMKFLKTK